MDERGGFAAALLDASTRGLATLVVDLARQRATGDADRELIASDDVLADTIERLRQLAESVAAGTKALFTAHIEWSRSTYADRGLSATFLPTTLDCLAEVLQRELPRDAWDVVRPHVDAGRAALRAPPPVCASLLDVAPGKSPPHSDLARRFLLALLEARRDDALGLIEKAQTAGMPVADLHCHVVQAALREIGRMWQAGEVHVADERLGTAIVVDALALLRQRTPHDASRRGRILVASVEGNLHDIGARIVADSLERAGFTTFYLGANVPSGDLLRAAVDHAVDVLALSAGLGVHVRATARLIAGAHALAERRLRVVVGGRIFNRVPELWRAVGADACATSAEEASAVCARLLAP